MNEKRLAAGDRRSSRKGSGTVEAREPVEDVLGAAAYNEQTSPHFGVDGCHMIRWLHMATGMTLVIGKFVVGVEEHVRYCIRCRSYAECCGYSHWHMRVVLGVTEDQVEAGAH